MGLRKSNTVKTTYLTIAGGKIWNRYAEKSDPNYQVQEWTDNKNKVQERCGAAYDELSGVVTNVYTKTHPEYGEALYVNLNDDGEDFTLNIKTNTANSQDMMKALLKLDLNKEILIKPYDFTPAGEKKRRVGLNFFQDGVKFDKSTFEIPKEWKTEKSFWTLENKKKWQRWLEDFSDWLISEIEEKVIPNLSKNNNVTKKKVIETPVSEIEVVEEEVVQQDKVEVTVSPIKMKKYLKEYISENYEDKELPKLSKDEIIKWYNLALETEELPFEGDDNENINDVEVDDSDLQAQLDALAGM